MNQEERDLLQGLFDRLRDSGNQPRDPEVERFIAEQIRYQPGAPYYMAQAVIVQEQALQDAQQRIAELESRVRDLESANQPRGQGGFLAGRTGGLFNRGSAPPPAARPSSVPQTAGPWGRGSSASGQQGYSQPMQQQPMQQPQPAAGGGGFLRGALATAAGVAGGALLYDQMKGMFGGGSGSQQAQSGQSSEDLAASDRALDEQQDAELAQFDDQDYGSDGGDLEI